MYKFLKWVSVLAFLASFIIFVAGIWVTEMRFIWISLATVFFSAFASAFAETTRVE